MAARTSSYDVVILGSDVVELAAALESARLGFRVLTVDIPDSEYDPECLSNYAEVLRELCSNLGIDTFVESDVEGEQQVLGIPANPFARSVREAVGSAGCWRVYLDRLKPLLRIGNDTNLRNIVSKRMGTHAWSALVLPELHRRFGALAEDVTITAAAPGLIEAVSRVGSLSSGVIEYIVADPRVAERVTISGGVPALRAALREKLAYFVAERMTAEQFAKKKLTARTVMVGVGGEQLLASLDAERAQQLLSCPVRNIGLRVESPGYETALPRASAAAAELRGLLMSEQA